MDPTVLAAYFLHPVCLWGLSTVTSDALSSIRPINAASALQASTQCEVLVPTNRLACRNVARKCLTDEIENLTSHVVGTWTAVNPTLFGPWKKLRAPGKMGKERSKVVHKCASFRIELMNEQPCSWEDNVFATSSFSSSALHLLPTHLCGAALLIGKWLGEVYDDVLLM